MSSLSSSTLFHFTRRLENLLGILRDEFRPRYCLEDFSGVFGHLSPNTDLGVAIPMVCFCDMPLSQTASHMRFYGKYALGLSKEWGMRAGVAPILYTYQQAATTDAIVRLHLEIERLTGTLDDGAAFSSETERLFCFMKPYDGVLKREGFAEESVRYYDEREWRYVPVGPWTSLNREQFSEGDRRNTANASLDSEQRLRFEPNDIRYVVVEKDDEIPAMITHLRQIKSPKYSLLDIDVLCTRIVSAGQVAADF